MKVTKNFECICTLDCVAPSPGANPREAGREHPWALGHEQDRAGLDIWIGEFTKSPKYYMSLHNMSKQQNDLLRKLKSVCISKWSTGFLLSKYETVMCDTAEIMIQTDAVFPHDCRISCCNSFSQHEDSCDMVNSTTHTPNLLEQLWSAVKGLHKMSKQKGGQHVIPSSALCSRYCKYLAELDLSGSCG